MGIDYDVFKMTKCRGCDVEFKRENGANVRFCPACQAKRSIKNKTAHVSRTERQKRFINNIFQRYKINDTFTIADIRHNCNPENLSPETCRGYLQEYLQNGSIVITKSSGNTKGELMEYTLIKKG